MAEACPDKADCPFAFTYQNLASVIRGSRVSSEGASMWEMRLPNRQLRMTAPVNACVALREGFKWPASQPALSLAVLAKAVPVSSHHASVPFEHVGYLSPSCGSVFFNVNAHTMTDAFRVFVRVNVSTGTPERRDPPATQAQPAPAPAPPLTPTPPLAPAPAPVPTSEQQPATQGSAPAAAGSGGGDTGAFASPPRTPQVSTMVTASTPAGGHSTGVRGHAFATMDWHPPPFAEASFTSLPLSDLPAAAQSHATEAVRLLISAMPRPQRRGSNAARLVNPLASLYVGDTGLDRLFMFLDSMLQKCIALAVSMEATRTDLHSAVNACESALDALLTHVQTVFFDSVVTSDVELKAERRRLNKKVQSVRDKFVAYATAMLSSGRPEQLRLQDMPTSPSF